MAYRTRGRKYSFRRRTSRRRMPGRMRTSRTARLRASPKRCGYRL